MNKRTTVSGGPAFTSTRLAGIVPGGFAIVMATGIVAIAARLLGHEAVGWVLSLANLALYPVLWLVMLTRFASDPRAVAAELGSHDRGPAFLTMVAATGVLGSEFATLEIAPALLPWLLGLAALLWIVLLYGFLAGATLRAAKPTVEDGLSGAWLLVVVATEALAVLGSFVAPRVASPAPLIFLSLAAFLLGGVLYLLLAALITYRFLFMPMSADDLEGPWWINMGAVAIATLAGARLMLLPEFDIHVALLRQRTGPLTLLFWATATFWIPLLVILFAWKHLVWRAPVRYALGQWSMVFPLGMYAAATAVFSEAANLPFLRPVAAGVFWCALLAWSLAAIGLVRAVVRFARGSAAVP
jgi:tellurite resistance protein TehA-like permease